MQGKSTLSASLCSLPEQPGSPRPWVHAHHFCKASDARTHDPVRFAKTLAYQLGLQIPEMAEALLSLDPTRVARVQREAEALDALLVSPLTAALGGGGRQGRTQRAVVLVDALDESEPSGAAAAAGSAPEAGGEETTEEDYRGPSSTGSALWNPILRAVTALAAVPGLLVVVMTRPDPPHIRRALAGRWGEQAASAAAEICAGGGFAAAPLSDFHQAAAAASPQQQQQGQLPPGWSAAVAVNQPSPAAERDSPYRTAGSENSRLLRAVCAELALRHEGPIASRALPPPATLSEAYALAFDLGWPAPGAARERATRLVQLLVAAREPPSVAALERLGVREALEDLPLFGFLFQVPVLNKPQPIMLAGFFLQPLDHVLLVTSLTSGNLKWRSFGVLSAAVSNRSENSTSTSSTAPSPTGCAAAAAKAAAA